MEFGVILVRKKDASDSILIFIVSAASFLGVSGITFSLSVLPGFLLSRAVFQRRLFW